MSHADGPDGGLWEVGGCGDGGGGGEVDEYQFLRSPGFCSGRLSPI